MLNKTARTKWKQYVKYLAENSPAEYNRLYNEVIEPNMYKTLPNGNRVNKYTQGLYDRAYNRAKRYGIDIIDFTKPGGPDRSAELLSMLPDKNVKDLGMYGGGAASMAVSGGKLSRYAIDKAIEREAAAYEKRPDMYKRLFQKPSLSNMPDDVVLQHRLGDMTRDAAIVADSSPAHFAKLYREDPSGYSTANSDLLSALTMNHEVEELIANRKHEALTRKNPGKMARRFYTTAVAQGYQPKEIEQFLSNVSKLPTYAQARYINPDRGTFSTLDTSGRFTDYFGSHNNKSVPANDLVMADHIPMRNDPDLKTFYKLRQKSKEEPVLRYAGGAVGQKEGFNRRNLRKVMKNRMTLPTGVGMNTESPMAFQHLVGFPIDNILFDGSLGLPNVGSEKHPALPRRMFYK